MLGEGTRTRREVRLWQERGASFSGHERDKLWLRDGTGGWADVSGLSGLDSASDGRSWAWLDLEHDGDLDAVLVSANSPRVQVFENRQRARPFVAVRAPVGGRIELTSGGTTQVHQVPLGEGFAAQNSRTRLLALPEAGLLRLQRGAEVFEVAVSSGDHVVLDLTGPPRRTTW